MAEGVADRVAGQIPQSLQWQVRTTELLRGGVSPCFRELSPHDEILGTLLQ